MSRNELILGSNTGSMFYATKSSGKFIVFGSEPLDEITDFDAKIKLIFCAERSNTVKIQ